MASTADKLAFSFSSTERRKGASAAADDAVQVSSHSDTRVTAFVRTSSPARVTLSAADVADSDIVATCTCAVAKKDRLCRHIWAALVKLEEQNHDFLLGKESISLAADDETVESEARENLSPRQLEFQQKQIAYKEKQKARSKEARKSHAQKARTPAFQYPPNVEEARRYFQANGFEMKQPFEISEITEAKKQLSRVFHPDKGGSHDEILELNRNFQILNDYLKS